MDAQRQALLESSDTLRRVERVVDELLDREPDTDATRAHSPEPHVERALELVDEIEDATRRGEDDRATRAGAALRRALVGIAGLHAEPILAHDGSPAGG